MNVSITPQLESFLEERVKAGRFNNTSEAVRAALRLLQKEEAEYEAKLAALRTEIGKGFVDEPVPFTPQVLEDIKERGRGRLGKKA